MSILVEADRAKVANELQSLSQAISKMRGDIINDVLVTFASLQQLSNYVSNNPNFDTNDVADVATVMVALRAAIQDVYDTTMSQT